MRLKETRMKTNLKIICGFPGVGKSFLCEQTGWHDSDSSKFSRDRHWPVNYLHHLLRLEGVALVSTHKEVREVLSVTMHTPFYLCYPDLSCKEEYLQRYERRGSPQAFIDLLDEQWEPWLISLQEEKEAEAHFVLSPGLFISDLKLENII